jgi:transcriptional antiterminator NusG
MQWYVLKAYSGSEDYVKKALEKRIKADDMEPLFGEIVVPKEKVVEMYRGQKRTSDRKSIPGYVLIQMELNDDTWHMVKSISKVLGFVGGTSDRPVPISEKEVNQMRVGVDKPKPKTVYEVGEVVRITDGPFADFNGVVEEVNYDKDRLRVAVLIFGRSTPVELEFGQVEKG